MWKPFLFKKISTFLLAFKKYKNFSPNFLPIGIISFVRKLGDSFAIQTIVKFTMFEDLMS